MTTGGKPRLMGISKRGNKYLRKLLVPWRSGGAAFAVGEHDTAGEMAEKSPAASAQEHGHCRAGEQTGADRLGDAASRRNI